MTGTLPVAAVLLAGGASRRFGGNKLLADWQGRPLVRAVLEAFPRGAFSPALVVTRHPPVAEIARELGYPALLRPQACGDLSGSIGVGLSAVGEVAGCLFAVCDQPRLEGASVLRLLEAFRAAPERICALGWQGRRGNPVIFPRGLLGELLALPPGGSGGRVIAAHPHLLHLVEAGSEAELADIDTPQDLRQMMEKK